MGRRTTIEVEDSLIEEAKAVLGTAGLKDTVDAALVEVIRAARRRALADRLATGEGLDFDEATVRAARRWRT
ncbi:MAG: type II toxin-antitoxin system VapB family antitoxin [Acidimicrobiia bacterium]